MKTEKIGKQSRARAKMKDSYCDRQSKLKFAHPLVKATKVNRVRKATFQKRWDDKSKSYFWRCTICFKKLRSRSEVHWYHKKPRTVLRQLRCGKCFNKQIVSVKLPQTKDKNNTEDQDLDPLNISDQKFKCSHCSASKLLVKNYAQNISPTDDHAEQKTNTKSIVKVNDEPCAEVKVEAESENEITKAVVDSKSSIKFSNKSDIKEEFLDSGEDVSAVSLTMRSERSSFRSSSRIRDRLNKVKSNLDSRLTLNSESQSSDKFNDDDDTDPNDYNPALKRRKTVTPAPVRTDTFKTKNNFSKTSSTFADVNTNEPVDKAEFIHGDVVDNSDLQGYLSVACEQIFQDPIQQTEHVFPVPARIIGVVFQCDLCDKVFKSKGELKSHQPTHFDDRPFVCELCGQRFKQMQGLRVHRFTHRSDTPYNCTVCERSFKTIAHLKSHLLTHSEEKQFMCNFCGKSFKQSTTLINHEKIHMTAKPFKCDLCDSSFKIKSTLDRHILTHTDERRFSCQYCDKKFKRSDALKAHERIHVCSI